MIRCPGCGKAHWWTRALTMECAFCAFIIPLDNVPAAPGGAVIRIRLGNGPWKAAA